MSDKKENLVLREELEEIVEPLRTEIREVKSMVVGLKSMIEDLSKNLSLKTTKRTGITSLGELVGDQSRVNPWTKEAWGDVLRALESLTREPPIEFSKKTFGPTMTALKKEKRGMTATEVAEITERKRNTESFYLKRLYLAGITKRQVQGRKVLYTLTDDNAIREKYSDLFT